jgi:hypothetical protein
MSSRSVMGFGAAVVALLVAAVVGGAPPAGAVDNDSRAAVRESYLEDFVPLLGVPTGWTGNELDCVAGAPSVASRAATVAAINWYRDVVGVAAVAENPTRSTEAQAAALLMEANNALSHAPPMGWQCWTSQGDTAAEQSNLATGSTGPRSIQTQVYEPGSGNGEVGHRRWLLHPRQQQVGIGSTTGYHAVHVFSSFAAPPNTTVVTWPSAGYFPVQENPLRWSFSREGADLSGAQVTVTPEGGDAIPVTELVTEPAFLELDTVVWELPTADTFANGADRTYEVDITGLAGIGGPTTYSYEVTLFDADLATSPEPPSAPGAPTGLQATPGDSQVALTWSAPASDGGSAITGYRVYRDGALVGSPSGTSFTSTGLTNGIEHDYEVAAVNAVGEGPRSDVVTSTPVDDPCLPPAFTDVPTSNPFFADICWMAAEEISTGYQPGPTYRPSAAVSRSAMSAFMYRLAGSPAFPDPVSATFGDVSPSNTFFTEIEWMASEQITTGTAATPKPLYKPSDPVSRGAMSAFMYRLAGSPTFSDPAQSTFGDVGTTHPFFTEIEWMASEQITTGTAATPKPLYKPASAVSRQAMSAFMHRLADGPGVGV